MDIISKERKLKVSQMLHNLQVLRYNRTVGVSASEAGVPDLGGTHWHFLQTFHLPLPGASAELGTGWTFGQGLAVYLGSSSGAYGGQNVWHDPHPGAHSGPKVVRLHS